MIELTKGIILCKGYPDPFPAEQRADWYVKKKTQPFYPSKMKMCSCICSAMRGNCLACFKVLCMLALLYACPLYNQQMLITKHQLAFLSLPPSGNALKCTSIQGLLASVCQVFHVISLRCQPEGTIFELSICSSSLSKLLKQKTLVKMVRSGNKRKVCWTS